MMQAITMITVRKYFKSKPLQGRMHAEKNAGKNWMNENALQKNYCSLYSTNENLSVPPQEKSRKIFAT